MKGEIIKETEKYIYTREVVKVTVVYWFVTFPNGYCCQVFKTEAEAKQAGPYLANLFHTQYTGVKSKAYDEYEVKHHRYKRR